MSDAERERWLSRRHIAYLWHCGDDYCDCYCPHIDEISPSGKAGYPWIHRVSLWKGTFTSSPELGEMKQMEKELKDESERRGLVPYVEKVIV